MLSSKGNIRRKRKLRTENSEGVRDTSQQIDNYAEREGCKSVSYINGYMQLIKIFLISKNKYYKFKNLLQCNLLRIHNTRIINILLTSKENIENLKIISKVSIEKL